MIIAVINLKTTPATHLSTNTTMTILSAIDTSAPIPSPASTSPTTVPVPGAPSRKSLSW